MAARHPLRLLAEDADDLAIISGALQDAVTRIGDISWEKRHRRLTIAFNRFCWEDEAGRGQRVVAGFQLGGGTHGQGRKSGPRGQEPGLGVRALTLGPAEPPGGGVTLP